MTSNNNLIGQTFGRLTVIAKGEDYVYPDGKYKQNRWVCQCSCDKHTIKVIREDHLIKEEITSCGCLHSEKRKRFNQYDLSGEYGIGWTTNTNEEFYFDLLDYDTIKNYCWHKNANGYCRTRDPLTKKTILMHILLGCKNHDHANRNKLDNRRNNLRPCTYQENNRNRGLQSNNTSGIIGVVYHKGAQKWCAEIVKDNNKSSEYLGIFCNKEDAIRARLTAEKEYFGEFAPQRHLFEEYGISI